MRKIVFDTFQRHDRISISSDEENFRIEFFQGEAKIRRRTFANESIGNPMRSSGTMTIDGRRLQIMLEFFLVENLLEFVLRRTPTVLLQMPVTMQVTLIQRRSEKKNFFDFNVAMGAEIFADHAAA